MLGRLRLPPRALRRQSRRCASFMLRGLRCLRQEASAEAMQAEVQRVLSAFWDEARLDAMARALVLHYFPLTVRFRPLHSGTLRQAAWQVARANPRNPGMVPPCMIGCMVTWACSRFGWLVIQKHGRIEVNSACLLPRCTRAI